VLRDLQRLRVLKVGDVLDKQQQGMAGGEVWRQLRRGIVVPGEGPVNAGKKGVQEHRRSVGILFPYLIWLETERRVMFDDGVDVGCLPAVMATGVPRARVTEGGEGGAESLPEDAVVLMVSLVGVEWLCTGWSAEDRAAAEERGSSELRGMVLGCRKPKLAGLRSTSGSRRGSGCTGSRFTGGVGVDRR
jgi:hypothetical protein